MSTFRIFKLDPQNKSTHRFVACGAVTFIFTRKKSLKASVTQVPRLRRAVSKSFVFLKNVQYLGSDVFSGYLDIWRK